uniref:Borealin C-terminal domain-containing protein n=1 Tax=Glossina morsitans morsitans TaxID=37546 RepID=A0A1B0G547_GLOMM
MPRTKINKNLKRYRESQIRDEKIREFESTFDGYCADMDNDIEAFMEEWDGELKLLRQRTSTKLLKMKMGDLLKVNLNTLEDAPLGEPVHLIPMQSNKSVSFKDEGYLTEDISRPCSLDSTASAKSGTVAQQQAKKIFRLPVPSNSARGRRPRRSRSACDEHSSSIGMEHGARNEMLSNHSRIHSVERKRKICLEGQSVSSSIVFMRWPKPGEMIVSKYGSPVIAQTLPDRFANVNIPLRDGAMSMRPKKLDAVEADILEDMNPQTLSELRILRDNLEKIVNKADKINK